MNPPDANGLAGLPTPAPDTPIPPAIASSPSPSPVYYLNPLERAQFQSLMFEITKAKAAMWDAQQMLQVGQVNLQNALRALANQHGMTGDVEMPQDFSLIRPKASTS